MMKFGVQWLFVGALLLLAVSGSIAEVQTDSCNAIKTEEACSAAQCEWCTSAAVPSACYSQAQASKLPPGVFSCPGKQQEEEEDDLALANLFAALLAPGLQMPPQQQPQQTQLPEDADFDDDEQLPSNMQDAMRPMPLLGDEEEEQPQQLNTMQIVLEKDNELIDIRVAATTDVDLSDVGALISQLSMELEQVQSRNGILPIADQDNAAPSDDDMEGLDELLGEQQFEYNQSDDEREFDLPDDLEDNDFLDDESDESDESDNKDFYALAKAPKDPQSLEAHMKVMSNYSPGVQILLGIAEQLVKSYFPNVAACVQDADDIYDSFMYFANMMRDGHSVGDLKQSLSELVSGLEGVKGACEDCGIAEISEKIAVFVAKVESVIGGIVEAAKLVIDGIDIYDDLRDARDSCEYGNYYQCGSDIADVINIFL